MINNKNNCSMMIVYAIIIVIVLLFIINYIIPNRIYAPTEEMTNVCGSNGDPNHMNLPSGLNNAQTVRQVARDKDTLALYFTTWCPHSVAFKPVWESFAKMNRLDVRMVAIDCEQDRSKCSYYPGVRGFPTVILHKRNGDDVLFRGDRTVLGLRNFLENNLN